MVKVVITFTWIMSLKKIRVRKIIRESQDKNREWILLLA